jgi:AbrB family looped-hinge helix DNA binding protein
MKQRQTVKVSSRYQIAVPQSVRQQLGIASGDRLLVQVRGNVIILLPEPKNYVEHMAGLHADVWKRVDADDYIRAERDAWTDLPAS